MSTFDSWATHPDQGKPDPLSGRTTVGPTPTFRPLSMPDRQRIIEAAARFEREGRPLNPPPVSPQPSQKSK
jgi:hypothetical protein